MLSNKNILIIKHGSIGDFVMAFSAIQSVREKFPNEKIILITTSLIARIFKKIPYINQICIDDRKSFLDIFNYLSILKKYQINFIIDLQNSQRTEFYHLITRCFFNDIKINSSKKYANFRYRIPRHGNEHVTEGLNNQLKLLNINKLNKLDISWLAKKDFQNKFEREYIVLIPGTSESGKKKRWPSKYFSKLSNYLIELGYEVLITGVSSDRYLIKEILNNSPSAINAEHMSKFDIFLNLSQNARLIISVDTGPAHVAALSDTPMIWLVEEGPYSKTNSPVSKNLSIIKSKNMSLISVKEVLDLAKEKLDQG
jgi:ADP-heptose:LPS heptosyltransferase